MSISKKFFIIFSLLLAPIVVFFLLQKKEIKNNWTFKSIDTMKYSRDMARTTLSGQPFSYPIDKQVRDIAHTGATHIAIGTPYDDEFLPVLKLWVSEARKNKLKVYFRGNFSGWEGWFEYKKIDRKTHLAKTSKFILENSDLFQDGDIFSSCPECENGEKINVNDEKSLKSYQSFLIDEYKASKDALKSIHRNVNSGYFSMNADIAYKVMDEDTTKKLGGTVVIDHYVKSPWDLEQDIRDLAKVSGGKIVLGEIGAPIPSIHGNMTEEAQAKWIEDAMYRISSIPQLTGVNYWVNTGGSTGLWEENGRVKKAVKVIKTTYSNKLPI